MSEKFTQPLTRRSFFDFSATGLATAALLSLTGRSVEAASRDDQPTAPHFPPRAKRAIHICLIGGYSQVDTFDYKPDRTSLEISATRQERTLDVRPLSESR
jgi:hypothetical protein